MSCKGSKGAGRGHNKAGGEPQTSTHAIDRQQTQHLRKKPQLGIFGTSLQIFQEGGREKAQGFGLQALQSSSSSSSSVVVVVVVVVVAVAAAAMVAAEVAAVVVAAATVAPQRHPS